MQGKQRFLHLCVHVVIGRRVASKMTLLDSDIQEPEQVPEEKLSELKTLLQQNKEWSEKMREETPNFFRNLVDQQQPKILWIGCSDSRVPSNQILNLKPGEVFVHRNIANQVVHSDINCLSVLEYAVVYLKVKHIIVCGHYGCGGIKAALSNNEYGLLDNWLRNIKDLYQENRPKFKCITDENEMCDLLTEENVAKSVYNVCHTGIVQTAWKSGQTLSVHGWCYRLKDGIIRDLNICIENDQQVEPIYRRMMEKRVPEE